MSGSTLSHKRGAVALAALSLLSVLCFTGGGRAFAAPFQGGEDVPFRFQAGQTARASEVNQNFDTLVAMVADQQLQIDLLTAQLDLVDDLADVLTIEPGELNGLAGPHVIFEGANLHVRSGTGATDDGGSPTGLGNLVIGYDEMATNQSSGDRDGAHNLVLGRGHTFTSTGGIVAGEENSISAPFASILAGRENVASGSHSCVSGGAFNQATGEESSVSGGVSNFATALRASASGGAQNTVSGVAASISGGSGGACGGFASTISGGQSGIASGDQSSICGGQSNSAFGDKATVSGGFNQSVSNDFDWRACDLTCP